jgi:hypothetical protein
MDMFQTKVVEKIDTNFLLVIFFSRKSWLLLYNVKKVSRAGQATDDMTLAH